MTAPQEETLSLEVDIVLRHGERIAGRWRQLVTRKTTAKEVATDALKRFARRQTERLAPISVKDVQVGVNNSSIWAHDPIVPLMDIKNEVVRIVLDCDAVVTSTKRMITLAPADEEAATAAPVVAPAAPTVVPSAPVVTPAAPTVVPSAPVVVAPVVATPVVAAPVAAAPPAIAPAKKQLRRDYAVGEFVEAKWGAYWSPACVVAIEVEGALYKLQWKQGGNEEQVLVKNMRTAVQPEPPVAPQDQPKQNDDVPSPIQKCSDLLSQVDKVEGQKEVSFVTQCIKKGLKENSTNQMNVKAQSSIKKAVSIKAEPKAEDLPPALRQPHDTQAAKKRNAERRVKEEEEDDEVTIVSSSTVRVDDTTELGRGTDASQFFGNNYQSNPGAKSRAAKKPRLEKKAAPKEEEKSTPPAQNEPHQNREMFSPTYERNPDDARKKIIKAKKEAEKREKEAAEKKQQKSVSANKVQPQSSNGKTMTNTRTAATKAPNDGGKTNPSTVPPKDASANIPNGETVSRPLFQEEDSEVMDGDDGQLKNGAKSKEFFSSTYTSNPDKMSDEERDRILADKKDIDSPVTRNREKANLLGRNMVLSPDGLEAAFKKH